MRTFRDIAFARCVPVTVLLSAALLPGCVLAQDAQPVDPVALVRSASWNELHSSGNREHFRYRLEKVDAKGSSVKEIVETRDGDVARLLEKNGKPLTPEEQQAEVNRLNNLAAHPELQQHRQKKEQEDSGRADEMVRLLPDAFLYTYKGMVDGPSGPAYRLAFQPNPKFQPPDREAEVYAGMAGELWIDKAEKRMAKLDAHLINDVDFGWGIVGRLYKGGSILVEQKDVGEDHWEQTHMVLDLTGKILMMKGISFKTTETASGFAPVEKTMGYQDAIHLLLHQSGEGQASRAAQ